MPTTTPNFGWSVPVSTDLVKDGATAIELLGDSIDTSLVDLKGGTTGQVLAKASGTDMDFSWVAQDDSNAIQNAIVDAKGDLISATADDTPARLAVGTNGQVLTADSAEATGLKWATVASSGPTFSAFRSGNQTVTGQTTTKVQINSESWDSDSCFDPTTNYRFTPNKAGYYQISSTGYGSGNTYWSLYKNGSELHTWGSLQNFPGNGSFVVEANGSSDYFELYVYINAAGSQTVTGGNNNTNFQGIWVRGL
jgi:hypothetical protein